jgi:hypothetical protein
LQPAILSDDRIRGSRGIVEHETWLGERERSESDDANVEILHTSRQTGNRA